MPGRRPRSLFAPHALNISFLWGAVTFFQLDLDIRRSCGPITRLL